MKRYTYIIRILIILLFVLMFSKSVNLAAQKAIKVDKKESNRLYSNIKVSGTMETIVSPIIGMQDSVVNYGNLTIEGGIIGAGDKLHIVLELEDIRKEYLEQLEIKSCKGIDTSNIKINKNNKDVTKEALELIITCNRNR